MPRFGRTHPTLRNSWRGHEKLFLKSAGRVSRDRVDPSSCSHFCRLFPGSGRFDSYFASQIPKATRLQGNGCDANRPGWHERLPKSLRSRDAEDATDCAAWEGGALRVGIGHDTHRLVEGRPLILGGVRIDHPLGPDRSFGRRRCIPCPRRRLARRGVARRHRRALSRQRSSMEGYRGGPCCPGTYVQRVADAYGWRPSRTATSSSALARQPEARSL